MRLPDSTRRTGGTVVSKRVRLALYLFLFLLIYDGALRKWVLPGIEQLLFIAKDALLLGVFLHVMLNRPRQIRAAMQPAAATLLLLYGSWVLLQAGNVNLPSVFVGIWGLKAHLLYASLILLLPLVFNSLEHLFRWLEQAYPWIVIPVCVLAFVQLGAPADSLINQQVRGGMDMISYFGESSLVRVTGTFSYITGMSSFVQVTTVLGMGLFLGGARSRRFLIGLGFAVAALPATGSRGVIVVVAVSAVMMLLAALVARVIGTRMALRIVVSIAILGVISLQAQDAAWMALQERTVAVAERTSDIGRSFTAFTNAFRFFDTAGFFGFGAGAANMGAPPLAKDVAPFSWFPPGTGFEEESGRIVLELGIFGWLFSQLMRIALFLWSAKLALSGSARTIRLAAVLALPVMALGMYVGNGVFSPPIGASYYWFCVALLAMAHFEQRQALLQRAHRRTKLSRAGIA